MYICIYMCIYIYRYTAQKKRGIYIYIRVVFVWVFDIGPKCADDYSNAWEQNYVNSGLGGCEQRN